MTMTNLSRGYPSGSRTTGGALRVQSAVVTLGVLLLSSVHVTASLTCDLPCVRGACVEGPTSFDQHPTNYDGSAFDFLNGEDEGVHVANNMHCDCPTGYTGLLCDVEYISCGIDNDHQCFHGGECTSGFIDDFGNRQFYCNCANAIDEQTGTKYVGTFCEHALTDYCDEEQQHSCVNGECNPDYPEYGMPCICEDGFVGPNCQYREEAVPECDLDCQNGGVCHFDEVTEGEKEGMYKYWYEDENVNDPDPIHMHCQCVGDWDGRHCEIPKVPCGDDHCFNGARCEQRTDPDTNEVLYHCDCTTTYSGTKSFAGRFCQYEATSYCSNSGAGLQGHLFCVNGGRCKPNPYEGCECDEPYTGFACEYMSAELQDGGLDDDYYDGFRSEVDPEDSYDCDLECLNDGVCRIGMKDMGELKEIVDNAPHLNETHSEFQHCVCPDGFYGLYCEERVDICGANEHFCLHGSECVLDGEDDDDNTHGCDCSSANSNKASVFAGEYCEHPVNDICTIDASSSFLDNSPLSFCVNGGRCKKRVTSTEGHPGCDCDPGWVGPHCELRESAGRSYGFNDGSGAKAFEVAVLVISLIAITMVTFFAVNSYLRRRRKRRNISNHLRFISNYRDEPDRDQVNIAPRRSSYIEEPYSAEEHSSSRDPMASHLAPKQTDVPFSAESTDSGESQPQVYIGPPRDEDGHELHNVEII